MRPAIGSASPQNGWATASPVSIMCRPPLRGGLTGLLACPDYGQAANTLARTATPPGQCFNSISPAILILQQLQQSLSSATAANLYAADGGSTGATAAYTWIPINFYDSREGEPRDNGARANNTTASTTTPVYTACSPAGVMNAVELDAGNLWLWLQKAGPYTGGSGNLVSRPTSLA